ncbi:HEPN domain-containing protein [Chryseobacterium sp. MIQD13]|uniref:HEPN domain-containing protein n=1 Tax=Chryseobacterium sp. MIQD13 TaxID=3422310 RepID=UPI003D2A4B67
MSNPLNIFDKNIESINSLASIYMYFENNKVEALDFTEILRAEFVLLVSAFDHYVHELVKEGMLAIFEGSKSTNKNFDNFTITLKTLNLILSTDEQHEKKAILDGEIKKITAKDSYQSPSSIEKALGFIDFTNVWNTISPEMGIPPKDIKDRLALIVNRRNKIAHEADFDYTLGSKNPIDRGLVDDVRNFIIKLVKAIHSQI